MPIETLGMLAANTAAGMLMGKYNDARQIKQQEKLNRMQLAGNKELAKYGSDLSKEMWDYTNYENQGKHLEAAGLNRGLMYGMSGGGGTTASTGSAGSVSGSQAPGGGGELQGSLMMAQQMELLKAQTENVKATTDKTKAETGNVPLTGENIKAGTGKLIAETDHEKVKQVMTGIQTNIAKLDERLKGETIEDMILIVDHEEQMALNRMDILERNNTMDKATYDDRVSTVKAEMFGAWTKNALMKQGITQSQEEIKLIQAKVQEVVRNGVLAWRADLRAIEGNNRAASQQVHDQIIKDVAESTKLPMEVVEKAVQAIILKGALQPQTLPKPHWQKGSER